MRHIALIVVGDLLVGGCYIGGGNDRAAVGRYGLNIDAVRSIVFSANGGDDVEEVMDRLARFPISVPTRATIETRSKRCAVCPSAQILET